MSGRQLTDKPESPDSKKFKKRTFAQVQDLSLTRHRTPEGYLFQQMETSKSYRSDMRVPCGLMGRMALEN